MTRSREVLNPVQCDSHEVSPFSILARSNMAVPNMNLNQNRSLSASDPRDDEETGPAVD